MNVVMNFRLYAKRVLPLEEVVCVEFKLDDVRITNEEEMRRVVEQINTDIEFSNAFKNSANREKLLDMQRVLYLYRRLRRKEERDAFRVKNDCKKCYYFQERKCYGVKTCLLEENQDEQKEEKKNG